MARRGFSGIGLLFYIRRLLLEPVDVLRFMRRRDHFIDTPSEQRADRGY